MSRNPNTPAAVDWLAGPGALRQLVREVDWTRTSLGGVETWTSTLRSAIRIGFESMTPMAVFAGRDFTILYNASYASLLGDRHPWAFGRSAHEVWSSSWLNVSVELRRVVEHCRAARVRFLDDTGSLGGSRSTQWARSLSPIRETDGRVIGVIEVIEARPRSVSVALLREKEARQRFFLRLTDRLRPLQCPRAIESASAEILGRNFGIGLVGFFEIGPDGDTVVAGGDYQEPGLPLAPAALGFGGSRLRDLGDFGIAMREQRDWHVEVPANGQYVLLNSRFALGPGESVAVVPVSRLGNVLGGLYVFRRQSGRNWPLERATLREVAERTRSAVERARADAAMRASEERLRALAKASTLGVFCASRDFTQVVPLVSSSYDHAVHLRSGFLSAWVPEEEQERFKSTIVDAIERSKDFRACPPDQAS
ncbi:MAG: PAS domain-containing protein [Polyangiaceae bacterium]